MSEREQFEKEVEGKPFPYEVNRNMDKWYISHLESKLTTLREDITAEAIMLIEEYALCPDEKLTGDAKKLKHKIIEAMGGDKLSKVREWVESYCGSCLAGLIECENEKCNFNDLNQILEGK